MNLGEAQVRMYLVSEGLSPMLALECQGVLVEGLEGAKLMRDWSDDGKKNNRHILYHPEHGILGAITLQPKGTSDMSQATKASMTISTFDNPEAKQFIRPPRKSELSGKRRRNLSMGPEYDLGAGQLRQLMKDHFQKHYPNLTMIRDATRVTGVQTQHSAQINLQRGAGPLRGVQAAQRADRRAASSGPFSGGPGSSSVRRPQTYVPDDLHRHYSDVLSHHGYIPHPHHDNQTNPRVFVNHSETDIDTHGTVTANPSHTIHVYHSGTWRNMNHDAMGRPANQSGEGTTPEQLDSHLMARNGTPMHNSGYSPTSNHANVLNAHGYILQSAPEDTIHRYVHQDETEDDVPSHSISVHTGSGAWTLDDRDNEANDLSGETSHQLDMHLSRLHGSSPASSGPRSQSDEYAAVLQHHRWEHNPSPGHVNPNVDWTAFRRGREYTHGAIRHSTESGRWRHTSSEGEVTHGHTPEELDDHLGRFYDEHPDLDPVAHTSHYGSELPGAVLHMHRQLEQHGWDREGDSSSGDSRWSHMDHPGAMINVEQSGSEGDPGWTHHGHRPDFPSLGNTAVVDRGPFHGIGAHLSNLQVPYREREHPVADAPEVIQMHNELRQRGWQNQGVGTHQYNQLGDQIRASRWTHPEHSGTEIHVAHQPDDDHDYMHRAVSNISGVVRGGTHHEIGNTLDMWYPTSSPTAHLRQPETSGGEGSQNLFHRVLQHHRYHSSAADWSSSSGSSVHPSHAYGDEDHAVSVIHGTGDWVHRQTEHGIADIVDQGRGADSLDMHLASHHGNTNASARTSASAASEHSYSPEQLHGVLRHHGYASDLSDLNSAPRSTTHPLSGGSSDGMHVFVNHETGEWAHRAGDSRISAGRGIQSLDAHLASHHGRNRAPATDPMHPSNLQASQDTRAYENVLQRHGYENRRRVQDGELGYGSRWEHPFTHQRHSVTVWDRGGWHSDSPDFPNHHNDHASQLDMHLRDLHSAHSERNTVLRNVARQYSYNHVTSGPEDREPEETWNRGGHVLTIHHGTADHLAPGQSVRQVGSGIRNPRDLDNHLAMHHAVDDMHGSLQYHGFEQVPGVTSGVHHGGSVWKRDGFEGSIHVNHNAGQSSFEDEPHWTHHVPGEDASRRNQGDSHQLNGFLQHSGPVS